MVLPLFGAALAAAHVGRGTRLLDAGGGTGLLALLPQGRHGRAFGSSAPCGPGARRNFVSGGVADQETAFLAEGAAQRDLWGINFYPDVDGPDWLEFDSMMNLRPSFGNRSRSVDDPAIRQAIADLVGHLVRP